MTKFLVRPILILTLSLIAVGCMNMGSADHQTAVSVTGKVVDPDGGNVGDLQVFLGGIQGVTSADGTFALVNVPFGKHLLIISKDNDTIHAEELTIDKREQTLEIVLDGVPIANVDGHISQLGEIMVVDGLIVSVGGKQAIMAADGTFSVLDVPVGSHRLVVEQPDGKEVLSTDFVLSPGGASITLNGADLCPAVQNPSDGNILSNSGFEGCMSGWRRTWATSGAVHQIDKTVSYSGTTSLRFSGEESSHAGNLVQTVKVQPNRRYKVSFVRKLENLSSTHDLASSVRLQFVDTDSNSTGSNITIGRKTGTNDWELYEAEVDIPANTDRVHFEIWIREATGISWWDDIYFGLVQ